MSPRPTVPCLVVSQNSDCVFVQHFLERTVQVEARAKREKVGAGAVDELRVSDLCVAACKQLQRQVVSTVPQPHRRIIREAYIVDKDIISPTKPAKKHRVCRLKNGGDNYAGVQGERAQVAIYFGKSDVSMLSFAAGKRPDGLIPTKMLRPVGKRLFAVRALIPIDESPELRRGSGGWCPCTKAANCSSNIRSKIPSSEA